MRYYIAASIEPDSKAMNYKEIGNEADLGLKFPEINEFSNGTALNLSE